MEDDVSLSHFAVVKAGNADDEYEDAIAAAAPGGGGEDLCRVAVADGATGSSFSGLWARLLCDAYVASGADFASSLPDRLPDLGRAWKAEVDRQVLPWYAAEKARAGAFAALLGVTVRSGGEWEAVAVGDCCLFQVRGDQGLVAAFPLTRADDFNTTPGLIGTYPADNRGLASHVRTSRGEWRAGDTLFFVSDALAAWFVREHGAGRAPWKWFAGLSPASAPDPAAFRRIVHRLRADGRLGNDDTTLVIARLRRGVSEEGR